MNYIVALCRVRVHVTIVAEDIQQFVVRELLSLVTFNNIKY
jgi:hypothetical protein